MPMSARDAWLCRFCGFFVPADSVDARLMFGLRYFRCIACDCYNSVERNVTIGAPVLRSPRAEADTQMGGLAKVVATAVMDAVAHPLPTSFDELVAAGKRK